MRARKNIQNSPNGSGQENNASYIYIWGLTVILAAKSYRGVIREQVLTIGVAYKVILITQDQSLFWIFFGKNWQKLFEFWFRFDGEVGV